jgi:hypothetical protein
MQVGRLAAGFPLRVRHLTDKGKKRGQFWNLREACQRQALCRCQIWEFEWKWKAWACIAILRRQFLFPAWELTLGCAVDFARQ